MSLWTTPAPRPGESPFAGLKLRTTPLSAHERDELKREIERRTRPYRMKVTMRTLLMILD
jgi:hypothetical protein